MKYKVIINEDFDEEKPNAFGLEEQVLCKGIEGGSPQIGTVKGVRYSLFGLVKYYQVAVVNYKDFGPRLCLYLENELESLEYIPPSLTNLRESNSQQ